MLAGMYEGNVSDHRYGEWIYFAERIPTEDYRKLAATFDPDDFDADEWVRIFKSAGMRYVVLTAKHHDGFALFKSSVSAFNIVDASPFNRDIVKELSEASHRAGLKFGIYYSHAQDWDDPNSAFDKRFTQREIHLDLPEDFEPDLDRYLEEKALPQIEELVKNYEIDLIWFDTPHEMTYERAKLFTDVVRTHRPDCLINSRIIKMGMGRIEQDILNLFDYVSIGDKEVPDRKLPLYFESPDSVSSSYGYKAHGKFFYHTGEELMDRMVHTIAAGGNYLLNNGPMGNGALDPEAVRLYGIIGDWMRLNSESLINTRANPFADRPAWGDITASEKGDALYLHILDWPETNSLTLNGLTGQVTSAIYLVNGASAEFVQDGDTATITLPAEPLDQYDTVIKVNIGNPHVTLETEMGDIVIEVMIDKAPLSGGDFLTYVEKGLYNDEGFYRVVRAAENDNGAPKIDVIQGGLIDDSTGLDPVAHETTEMTGIKHTDGTLSLARDEPGTGSAAYFVIVIGDQPALDYGATRNPDKQGFAAFGRVVSGMDVVRKIHSVPADRFVEEEGYTGGQMLKEPVRIISARIN